MRNNPQRQFLRHTVNVPLEVVNVSASTPTPKHSVNVSYGGLAFESDECPEIGDTVQLRIATVDPPFEARVWITSRRRKGGHTAVDGSLEVERPSSAKVSCDRHGILFPAG